MSRLTLATLIVGATLGLAAPASAGDWVRYGGDDQVTNNVPTATARAAGFDVAAAPSVAIEWRTYLDGAIVASPLYLDGTGGRVSTVYVATEVGSVYALSAADGSVLWQRSLPTATITEDDCGTYGISSTGILDRGRGVLYVAAADGTVHALGLATGADAPGWPVQLQIDTTTAYVWGGLTLVGDRLYVPISSYCDTPDPATGLYATGGLVAVDVDRAAPVGSFAVSAPGTLGGIWGYGGASVDPLTGDLWVATGNSEPLGAGEAQAYAESVVALSPSLSVDAWNRPDGIPSEALDSDFGSTPLLFQPYGCPPLAAAHNKNGMLYVWRRDDLGGGPIWSILTGPEDVQTPFVGEPSWSPDLQTLFVGNTRGNTAAAFTVGTGCTFPPAPTWVAHAGRGVKPPPLVLGDLLVVPGGASSSLTVLNASTGARLATVRLASAMYSSPIFAGKEIVAANAVGTVFAITPGGSATTGSVLAHVHKHLHRPWILVEQ